MLMRYLCCFVSGLILVAAFEPFAQAWLAFISLGVLFYYWRDASTKQALYLGFCFGLGLFLAGVSWVYVSLHTYGGMPLWMGGIAVIAFAAVLSVFIALPGYCAAYLFPIQTLNDHRVYRLIAIPPLWVLFEWLKSWVFTGFPWLDLGYTQTSGLLGSLAPIGGVYLVSLVVLLITALTIMLLQTYARVFAGIALLIMTALTWALQGITWSHPDGDAINIAVVQGNVAIEKKWQSYYQNPVIQKYAELTRQLHQQELDKKQPIQLTVWPETALPLFVQQTDLAFWRALMPNDSALLTGLLDAKGHEEEYNAAVLYCDQQQQVYRKRHLVPFGEYLPLRFLFDWVLDYLQLPMSDFSAWQGKQTLQCSNNINISLSICYEDAFASEMQAHLGDASILVNISEDAWFGDSLAPHQRLQMAQMRAKELARPLIRSANTGPSVFIDERGTVLNQTEQFKAQAIAQRIQPMQGQTPFARFGNWVVGIVVVWLLVLMTVRYQYFSKR